MEDACSTTSRPARGSAASHAAAANDAARDWLRRVGLAGFEDRYPHQLSGGMRKRVALAQSLINEPRVLLMDEPFCALDVQTRAIMSNELLALWDLTRPAVVFVTHDLEEAIALADKVVVLTAGPGGTVKATFPIDLPRPRRGAGDPVRPATSSRSTSRSGRPCAPRSTSPTPAPPSAVAAGDRQRRRHRTTDRDDHARPACRPTSRPRAKRRNAGCWCTCARLARPGGRLRRLGMASANDRRTSIPLFWGNPSGVVGQPARPGSPTAPRMGSLGDADPGHPARRPSIGFVIGVVLGVVCGIALGRHPLPRRRVRPVHQGRSTPSRASCSARSSSLAFGLGLESKVVLVVVLVFFGVFFNAFQGAREVDRNLIANARILGASRWQVTRQVVLPSAFTWIIASLHVSFGFALIGAIVGEFLGAQQGSRPADPQRAGQLRRERRAGPRW